MKSSNAQILEDLRRYRMIASNITPQRDENIRNILQACTDKLVQEEFLRRKAYIEPREALVKRQEQLISKREAILQEIKAKEERKLKIKIQTSAKSTAAANEEKSIANQIVLNFEDQITAMRIRDTKNTLGQKSLQGKTLEALLEEEKTLRQKINDIRAQVSQAADPFAEEIDILDAELGDLQKQRDENNQEIKRGEVELKQNGISATNPRVGIDALKKTHDPDNAKQGIGNVNLLEYLSSEDRRTVEAYCDALITTTVALCFSTAGPESCKFPHLYRVLCASTIHPLAPKFKGRNNKVSKYSYVEYLAMELGPSIVCEHHLQDLIISNYASNHTSNYTTLYTTYTELPCTFHIKWNDEEKKVFPQAVGERQGPVGDRFVVIKANVLDALEKLLTQQPEIAFPDLLICMSKVLPDSRVDREALDELKRLYEETPEQVLVTEQRYYKEQELKLIEKNARLEREEIARQAELDREHAEYLAEQDRRAMERQAELDREQAEIAMYLQEEHNRTMERAEQDRARAERDRAQAEDRARREADRTARRAESDAKSKAWTQCRVCAKFSGCRNPGVPGCGAFVPRN